MTLITFISVFLLFNVSVVVAFDEEIFLVENKNDYNQEFNDIFEKACGNYYNVIRGPIEISFLYPNVIQFAVPGLYNYNDNQRINHLMYAGSTTDPNKINCSYIGDGIYCNETANLVSIPLFKRMESVYNFVQSFQPDRVHSLTKDSCRPNSVPKDLDTVLICHSFIKRYEQRTSFEKLNLIIVEDNWNCDEIIKHVEFRLLAILRPEPGHDTLVPTVLFKTPYLTSMDRTGLPNSVSLLPWRLLKFGILKFIQKVGWQRVVVVSDDSEFSVDFEEELTDLLQKERIVYTSVRCDDAECSSRTLIQKMRKVSPMIVIANMEMGRNLIDLIHKFSATWIIRDVQDMNVNNLIAQIPHNRNVFLVTMNLPVKQGYHYHVYRGIPNELLSILGSINYVYNSHYDKPIKKSQFYRKFAKKINKVRPASNEAIVYVKKISPIIQLILKMYVNDNGAEVQNFTQPFKNVPEDGSFCLAYTYDYFNPCENEMPMIFMFVIFLFIVTVFWLTCFFDKVTPLNRHNYHRHYD